MTEQQPYQVVRRYPDFEVRSYPPAVLAEVLVDASFEQAGTRAFNSLFGYISGRNLAKEKIAMTAPVLQSQTPAGRQAVAFVLPPTVTASDAPSPDDAQVRVHQVPGTLTAAISYGGRWSRDSFERHRALLASAIAREGLEAVGEARFARYNPPFTPWFLRRNEVLVDLTGDPVD